jgi:hypothetical protein
VNEDVVFLAQALRETPLAWIADEIESEIARGRMVEKTYTEPGKKRKKTATTVEDYSDQQQLEIALHCIANYITVTPHVWKNAVARLAKNVKGSDTNEPVHVVLADATNTPFAPFQSDFGAISQRLYRLLRDAWPAGAENFDSRFAMPEESK